MKFLRKFFIFAVILFSINSVSAKNLYLNNSEKGDCLTETTACDDFEKVMNLAENGDEIILLSNIVYGWNNTWIFNLKWVTIEWNNNRLTFRGQDINLLWDATLNDLDLSILPDWSLGGKIFMNWKNLTLNSIKTQTQANDILPTIIAWSKENTGDFSDFNLVISSARWDNHFKEIITSGLDSKVVPVNVEIWEGVKVEKVRSIWEKSGSIANNSTKTTHFENIFLLEVNSINWLSDFYLKNILNLNLKDNTNISVSNFENISFLTLWRDIILSFKNSWNIEIENLNSFENNLIKLWNENIFSVKDFTINSNLKFEIDSNEEKIFVIIPTEKEENISWESKTWLKNFEKISEENWFSKFWLKAKEESEDYKKLKELLDEFDSLPEEQQDLVDIEIYNSAADANFFKNVWDEDLAMIIKNLEKEIKKAKWEEILEEDKIEDELPENSKIEEQPETEDNSTENKTEEEKNIENAESTDETNNTENTDNSDDEKTKEIADAKDKLKKLLDLANLSSTTSWKTEDSIKNLKEIILESQKIFDNVESTLEQINSGIEKLDLAIKSLKNKTTSSSSTWGGWSSRISYGNSSSLVVVSSNSTEKNIEEKKVENTVTTKEIKTENLENKEQINKNLKTIKVFWKDRIYEVKNTFSSCPMVSNIVSDFNSDYIMSFEDVNKNHNFDEIQRLEKVWIIKWTKAKTFEPNRWITRAEFLAIVLKSHCYDFLEKPENLPFYDVDLDSWQAKVVKVANELWIISWYPADEKWISFRPNNEISKIEALAIIYKISNLEIKEEYSDSFTDKAAFWQAKVLSNLEYLWILNPENTNNKINPNNWISRNEIVKILVDVMRLY